MIVKLNGYVVNDPNTNAVYVGDQITGLELPSIRTSSGNYTGRSGGYVGGQYFSARDISLTGTVFSSNISTLESTRKAFQVALRGTTGTSLPVELQVVTNAGAAYVLYCNLIDFTMPIDRSLFTSTYKLELEAPDPIIYDDTTGGALTAAVSKQAAGGYTYPVVYPVVYAGGATPTSVSNTGTETVYPVITLTGSMTGTAPSSVDSVGVERQAAVAS